MTTLTAALLESLHVGEHWIDDTGDTVEASGDVGYNHEGYVISQLIPVLADAAGYTDDVDKYESDYQWFYNDLIDWVDSEGEDIDEAIEEAYRTIAQSHGQSFANDMRGILAKDSPDARAFAIRHWGWVRVAGTDNIELEMRDFTPAMLKRAGNGVANLLWEAGHEEVPDNIPVDISIYGRNRRLTVTIGDLLAGSLGEANDAGADTLQQRARAAVDAMDNAIRHPYYASSGDGD